MAAPQARTGRFAALASGSITRLAGLAQHLGNERIAALFGLAGADAKAVFVIAISRVIHDATPEKISVLKRSWHADLSMPTRR